MTESKIDAVSKSYREALRVMELSGPRRIHVTAAALTDETQATVGDEVLRGYLNGADPDDPLRKDLAVRLATWDAAEAPDWAGTTLPHTLDRRNRINGLLGVDDKTSALFSDRFPMASSGFTVVDGDWEPWYLSEAQGRDDFYWRHYLQLLASKPGFDGRAVASLDAATTSVVERLADPTRTDRYQAKGLVVGYVQSGKTANFTGVIAKCVDAGYRLIVVLTGSTDLLRTQTQRRLDMELVGRENLLRGLTEDDTESFDYHDDPDWLDDKFVRHGVRPAEVGKPDIIRLTTRDFDYRSLQQGISALDFPRRDPTKPLNHPSNLMPCDARLVVVKKNGIVLRKLVKDLTKITARLSDIPAIIIDDESDQASPNTSNPKKWQEDEKERTTINGLIGDLLTSLPRAQYVGYTATPFANVFIDPSDAEDIFPSNFLISLEPPTDYMGARDFHDFDEDFDEPRTFNNSRRTAHVRPLPSDDDDDGKLLEALDAFVLTGAVKLYRQDRGVGTFRHHTMLIHEAMKRDVHSQQAAALRGLWNTAGYYSSSSAPRLRELYEKDILPCSLALAPGLPAPPSYADLMPYVGRAAQEINATGNPVLVVNSDDDIEQEDIDFDKRKVWRILIGGNKLARGFTIEGLTVSYYRRMTKQQDTLMQMGRWFGFRRHYRDLVRLYITPALHQAFEASCLDEAAFRDEIRRYAMPVDGHAQITPAQIPPLVAQHLSWLKPTAPNKMYNAVLAERRSPGVPVEPRCYPSNPDLIRDNTIAFRPLIEAAGEEVRLHGAGDGGKDAWNYRAFIGSVGHGTLVSVLGKLTMAPPAFLQPDLQWLTTLTPAQVEQWIVILPQQTASGTRRRILDHTPISVFTRQRLRLDYFSVISDVRHRRPLAIIKKGSGSIGDPAANAFMRPKSGAMLIYPTVERIPDIPTQVPGQEGDGLEPNQVTLAFHLVAPLSAAGTDRRLVTFTTIDSNRESAAIIDKR